MYDELIKEASHFDTSKVTVSAVVKIIQARLSLPSTAVVQTIRAFRAVFDTGIKESIGVVDMFANTNVTIDEAIRQIRMYDAEHQKQFQAEMARLNGGGNLRKQKRRKRRRA